METDTDISMSNSWQNNHHRASSCFSLDTTKVRHGHPPPPQKNQKKKPKTQRCEMTGWTPGAHSENWAAHSRQMVPAAHQKQLATLLQQTSISGALTLGANTVDGPHDQKRYQPGISPGELYSCQFTSGRYCLWQGDRSVNLQNRTASRGKWPLISAVLWQ